MVTSRIMGDNYHQSSLVQMPSMNQRCKLAGRVSYMFYIKSLLVRAFCLSKSILDSTLHICKT